MMARAGMMALALLAAGIAAAFAQDRIHLHTNEAEIGEVLRDGGVAIDDPLAVFGAVLKNLPERVQVYPTENYFYFRFTQNGAVYAGNIRLAAADRDQGKVNFAYNEQPDRLECRSQKSSRGAGGGAGRHRGEGRAADLSRHARGKDRHLRPQRPVRGQAAAGMMRADETFLGPVFDESAIRFFLVFNSRLKIFHFVLDETTPVADQFAALEGQRADPDRQAHRLCLLSIRRPENPGRRRRAAIAAQHLSRRAVRPAAGEFHRRRGAARSDPRRRSERQRQDRPARQFCRRLGPLSDPSLSALSADRRSRGVSALRHVKSGGGRPTARPASSSTTTRRSAKIRGRWL